MTEGQLKGSLAGDYGAEREGLVEDQPLTAAEVEKVRAMLAAFDRVMGICPIAQRAMKS